MAGCLSRSGWSARWSGIAFSVRAPGVWRGESYRAWHGLRADLHPIRLLERCVCAASRKAPELMHCTGPGKQRNDYGFPISGPGGSALREHIENRRRLDKRNFTRRKPVKVSGPGMRVSGAGEMVQKGSAARAKALNPPLCSPIFLQQRVPAAPVQCWDQGWNKREMAVVTA